MMVIVTSDVAVCNRNHSSRVVLTSPPLPHKIAGENGGNSSGSSPSAEKSSHWYNWILKEYLVKMATLTNLGGYQWCEDACRWREGANHCRLLYGTALKVAGPVGHPVKFSHGCQTSVSLNSLCTVVDEDMWTMGLHERPSYPSGIFGQHGVIVHLFKTVEQGISRSATNWHHYLGILYG